MSIWQKMSGAYRAVPNWPNPFRRQMKRVRELACADGWLAEIEFDGRMWGKFLYDVLIPQPREIIRKSVTGSYRCGFYFGTEWGSPLDIIWQDESASRFVAKLAHLPVTGLFVWWAAESFMEALSTWTTVLMLHDHCEAEGATVAMFEGHTFTGVDGPGSIAGYAEAWGNPLYHDTAVGAINAPVVPTMFRAYGRFTTGNRLVDNVKIGHYPADPVTGFPADYVEFSNPTPGKQYNWATPGRFSPTGGHDSVLIYVKFAAGSFGFGVDFGCGAYTADFGPAPDQNKSPLVWPGGPDEYCLPYK